jgi:hypothetical protein
MAGSLRYTTRKTADDKSKTALPEAICSLFVLMIEAPPVRVENEADYVAAALFHGDGG